MPTYSVALLFMYSYFGVMYSHQFWYILAPVFLFSFAVPALLIFVLYKLRLISDLSLTQRRERVLPYLITLISCSFMVFYYYKMGMPAWFLMFVIAPVIIMIIALFITLFWKISAHMFGIGGLLGGAMGVSFFVERANPVYMLMGLFLLAGLIGSSRLILQRHTVSQVFAGFALGLVVSFVFVWAGVHIKL
ncbi:MAG TPA: hypothetical protein DDZ96_14605 [Porphyromonadaceae bacterium]|jgi:hypothetical protein|nr:hypothetical protein [Porphyromonadaceae bacterium]HBK32486.1 hypothetical protein [Porphyromonadaceae bacterium]HBL35023.1 hypothetical protein [Porphyromonadaceae bacterium]HBX19211.1 hypothetical protein [Porphyromonadaceae bacterium]HBX45026.1 hypothetical protein [Porphyromonadaceae bacterium]